MGNLYHGPASNDGNKTVAMPADLARHGELSPEDLDSFPELTWNDEDDCWEFVDDDAVAPE